MHDLSLSSFFVRRMRESKSVFARSPSRNKRPLPPGGYRDPTLAQWVKHSAAKEDEDKKKTIFVPSPRASARTRLVLSWYAAGAVPWQVGARLLDK